VNQQTFDEFKRNEYDAQLLKAKTRAKENERLYRLFQWSTITLSMITAILVGTDQLVGWVLLKFLALVTSVVVSGLATILTTFDYKEKWSKYAEKALRLEREYNLYLAEVGDYSEVDQKNPTFVEKFYDIVESRDQAIKYLSQ
jgi:hypothetical protein